MLKHCKQFNNLALRDIHIRAKMLSKSDGFMALLVHDCFESGYS